MTYSPSDPSIASTYGKNVSINTFFLDMFLICAYIIDTLPREYATKFTPKIAMICCRLPAAVCQLTKGGGEENRRKVDPYKVMFFDSTFYLIGLCHLCSEVRMFVLDRIKMMNITDETFEIPSDFDLETYMQSPFKVIHDKPVKVTIRFDKKVAGYIKEKIWHHSQEIEPQKYGSIIFSAEVAGTDEVRHWVMSWGKSAEIISPDFLRHEISLELRDTLTKYSDRAAIADKV